MCAFRQPTWPEREGRAFADLRLSVGGQDMRGWSQVKRYKAVQRRLALVFDFSVLTMAAFDMMVMVMISIHATLLSAAG